MPARMSRATYADMYGPTTGDRVRLGDTDLIIEVEKDLTTYGEEVKFGGGKVIRDGMGQSQIPRAGGAADTVITNALILDHSGIYKADVGLRDGRICKIGKAGNPDTQPNVTIIIGPGTEMTAEEHVATAETEPAEVPTAGEQCSEREPLEPEYDHRSDKITMVKAIVGSLCVTQEDGWRCKVSSCTGDFHRLKDCLQFGSMDPKDRMALVERLSCAWPV